MSLISNAQQTADIPEDQVPPNVVAKHYHSTSAATSMWQEITTNEGVEYAATYDEHGLGKVAIYNKYSRLVREITSLGTDAPVSIVYLLEERFEKFKVLDYRRIEDLNTQVVTYELNIKTKSAGELSLLFDSNLMLIEDQLAANY